MTAQEEQMLQGLTDRVNNTKLSEKDPEAEQLLQDTLARNPDALYILAQTLRVQQYALDQAQKQLADLRAQFDQVRQQQQPKHATSFLGNLLGRDDAPPAPPPQPPQAIQPQFTPVPSYPPPSYAAPQYAAPQYPALQSGGFLRSAAQTAAGVAAGALAFQGIESLMHGFGHPAGYGSGIGSFGEMNRPEEVINNYYGDASPHEHSEHAEHLSRGAEDRPDDSRISDAVYHDDNIDNSDRDDSNLTSDTFANDSNDFDDSSSFDSGNDDNVF